LWFCEADPHDIDGDKTPQAQGTRRCLSFEAEKELDQKPPEVTPEEFAKALPMSVVRKRIDRLMKPKADGTYKVPLELVEEWKKGDQMNILREFREAGLDKDRPTSAGHKMSDHKQFFDLKLLGTCLTEPTAHCRTSLFESLSSGSKRRCLKTTCGSMASLCQKRTCEMMVLKSNPAHETLPNCSPVIDIIEKCPT
jgi:hypothetical protein